MSNVCLMGVGEASIKLIVDHSVNFSYLENPSFPKCCECGGYDGRRWVKTERWLASNAALCSGKILMGFTDSNDSDDETLVLMTVLVRRSDSLVFVITVRAGGSCVESDVSTAIVACLTLSLLFVSSPVTASW